MKVGTVRNIKFWSLTNAIGPNLGVIFDVDCEEIALCRVVLREDGTKKWQFVNSICRTESAIECLSMCEMDDVTIIKNKGVK